MGEKTTIWILTYTDAEGRAQSWPFTSEADAAAALLKEFLRNGEEEGEIPEMREGEFRHLPMSLSPYYL